MEYNITIKQGDAVITVQTDSRTVARNVKALQTENAVEVEVNRTATKTVKFKGLD